MTRLHWRPDASERLLLRAALGDGADAARAFGAWDAGIDWQGDMEPGVFRLLPLVHGNLSRIGVAHPRMPRLAGVYRHSWCEAQQHLRRGEAVVRALAECNIPVMLSKGLLLGSAYYRSPAERPMSDIDLLVPRDHALPALDVLRALGFALGVEGDRRWRTAGADRMRLNIGVGLRHAELGEVDLHWEWLHEFPARAIGARWWAEARPFAFGDLKIWQPAPTHLLFHVITHGLRPNPLSPLRWVADAATIVRRSGVEVDWDELRWLGRQLRVESRVHFGLGVLSEIASIELPAAFARAPHTSMVERIEERCAQIRVDAPASRRGRAASRLAYLLRLGTGPDKWHIPRLAAQSLARRIVPRRAAQ